MAASTTTVSTTGAPRVSRRWLALGGISVALLAVGLDATVLSLALPTLAGAFHASESELQWFVTSYTLALTAAMLPMGLLGDRYGRRAVLLCGLVVFGAASAACAFAPSSLALIAARAILGAAGAAMIVMALSVITVLFDEDERPRAIGVWGAANFLALPLGPIVGGWMLANAWWGWVFLINVPVVIAGFVLVVLVVPESRAETRPAIDWPGIVGSSLGLTLLMFGVIEAGRLGWGDAGVLGLLLAGVALLAAFVGLGVPARPGRPPAARRPAPVPRPQLHLGRAPRRPRDLRPVRAPVHDAPVLAGGRRARCPGGGPAPPAAHPGHDPGRDPGRPGRLADRTRDARSRSVSASWPWAWLPARSRLGPAMPSSGCGASRPGSARGSACPPPRPLRWWSSTPITAASGRRSCRRP